MALKKTSPEAKEGSHGLCRRLALRLGPLGSVAVDFATHLALPAAAVLPPPAPPDPTPPTRSAPSGGARAASGAVTSHSVISDSGARGQTSRTLKNLIWFLPLTAQKSK